jgi:hypothetical protein
MNTRGCVRVRGGSGCGVHHCTCARVLGVRVRVVWAYARVCVCESESAYIWVWVRVVWVHVRVRVVGVQCSGHEHRTKTTHNILSGDPVNGPFSHGEVESLLKKFQSLFI